MVQVRFVAAPHLPVDTLRVALQVAAAYERRIARRLVLVSRAVQEWIDPILYSNVSLSRAASTFALWQTISFSRKPASFFAEYVKVLCVSEEAHTDHLTQILLACTGISSLTFWTIPTPHWKNNLVVEDGFASLDHRSGSSIGPRLFLSRPQQSSQSKHEVFPDECFDAIRPRRLVASFRDMRYFSSNPDFSRPLFTFVTHLSVLNSWEDWIFWDLVNSIPSITHLALDLNLARSRPIDDCGEGGGGSTTRRLTATIKNALRRCPRLCVCVLVLLFDSKPLSTMARISETLLALEQEDSNSFPFNNPPSVPDPRLVFLMNTQPFGVREAHGSSEDKMWKAAERKAAEQKMENGPSLLVV